MAVPGDTIPFFVSAISIAEEGLHRSKVAGRHDVWEPAAVDVTRGPNNSLHTCSKCVLLGSSFPCPLGRQFIYHRGIDAIRKQTSRRSETRKR